MRLTKRTCNTLVKMADTALEFLPMTGAPSDIGPGRKIFFPIPLKNNPECMEDFLYIFVESKLPFQPADADIGFDDDDIVDTTGVYLFKNKKGRSCGQVYSLENLFQEVITDLSLQNRMIYRISEMKEIVHLDTDFLDAANADRGGRSPEDLRRLERLN